ncbi:hypothetical protein AD006_01160 [Pseudonocardia sp. EC080610-09]|uniref:hypothetical protein n=1 Tax=unclassified Pseudonocardia TaxID=2619320 RepID=UPI000705ACE2|nr:MULTISPECIES: hypothetical protein [unclassified Pseudonocardia]ALL74275.1 hypothetical protein AD006_01160 [Pseudonocardia sp. EC080610-09]ALL81298.1 hypothetical protein AD017_08985 [Pseudonocardia sp. EC080619-01]
MAEQKFHSQVAIQPGTSSNHAVTKQQLDTAAANASNLDNATGSLNPSLISGLQAVIDGRIDTVLDIDNAPELLNTLSEIAAAINDDEEFATTITALIAALESRVEDLEESPSGAVNYKTTIGDNTVSSFAVTHSLATTDVVVSVVEVSTGQTVFPVVSRTDNNTVTVDFGSFVPTVSSHRVLVQPV